MDLAFIPLGGPWKSEHVESSHSRQRDEFVSINTFATILHARVALTDWHREHNHVLRHSNIGYKSRTECGGNCIYSKFN